MVEEADSCHLWDKVSGGNLYPLSYVRHRQTLCWLSCCASCQLGRLGMSVSVIVGLHVVQLVRTFDVSSEVFVPL